MLAVGWLAGLLAVGLGCASHTPRAEPPLAEATPAAHIDLGPDPFRELDAGPPPAPPPVVAEPPPAPDPRLAEEAELQRQAQGTDCGAMLSGVRAHPNAAPAVQRQVVGAAIRCFERRADLASARTAALVLLHSCGPDAVGRCRGKAFALLKRLASKAPKAPALAAHVKELLAADACLARAERGPAKKLEPCLAMAERVYVGDGDALMVLRSKAVRARSAASHDDPGAERLFSAAAAACTAPRCAVERIRVLDGQAALAQKQKRLDAVLLIRLQEDRIAVEALAPARRLYARSAKVDAACAALDAAQGPGACRALELKSEGHWTFHDPSAHTYAGDLPKDEALKVNDDFLVTLQGCFREEAGRLPVPSEATYHLRWTINLDGRVEQVHLDAPADDAGPLASCLRERFQIWRYPQSHGELQHVEQSFTVTARPR